MIEQRADRERLFWSTGSRISALTSIRVVIVILVLLGSVASSVCAQTIRIVDGVGVLTDDGTLLTRAKPIDIQSGTAFRLVSNANGAFDISVVPLDYDEDVETLVVDRTSVEDWIITSLPFDFRIGEDKYRQVRVSKRGCILLGAPDRSLAMLFSEDGLEKQYEPVDAILDATPRLCPLFSSPIHSTDHRFTSAYLKLSSDTAVFRWRGRGFDATGFGPVDFELVLKQSGEAIFSYKNVEGVLYGAMLAVTGRESWWNSPTTLAKLSASLPWSSIDEVRLDQLGGTDVLVVRFQPVALETAPRTFGVDLYSDTSFTQFLGRVRAEQDANGWTEILEFPSRQYPVRAPMPVQADRLPSVFVPLDDFGLVHQSFAVKFFVDSPATGIDHPSMIRPEVSEALHVDLSAGFNPGRAAPLMNVYTLPVANLRLIKNVLLREKQTEWDHAFIFPVFEHGEGSYSCCGNAAVRGIGPRSDSALPPSPDLTILSTLPRDLSSYRSCEYLQHGFGHRFLFYIGLKVGDSITNVLNPDLIHPSFFMNTQAAFPVNTAQDWSAMGGTPWRQNSDGTFSPAWGPQPGSCGFSWVELYLMGLVTASEVPEWFYLENAREVPGSFGSRYNATKVRVTIDQVIAANGPRVPAAETSQKNFTVLFVLLTTAGREISASEISLVQRLRQQFAAQFERAVGDRARMNTTFLPGTGPRRLPRRSRSSALAR